MRLSISAYQMCSGLGFGRAATRDALRAGHHGLTDPAIELPFATFTGAVAGSFPSLPTALSERDTRLTRLAAALLDSIDSPVANAVARFGADRIGLFVGTSTAGIAASERAYGYRLQHDALPDGYDFVRQHAYHGLLDVLRALTGIQGPGHVISTACSSSGKVFASAARMIAAGFIDAAVVGGIDTMCATTLHGFHSLGALDDKLTAPFSADRSGINIGEGGALFLVQRGDDGPVHVLGVGESSDAHHMSAPHPEGLGAHAAMRDALQSAGVDPSSVSHVNAHGTGTKLNDAAESLAIQRLLGAHTPVVSTKSYTGHLLGAAGAIEAAIAALTVETGFVPASLRADPQADDCPVAVAHTRIDAPQSYVLSNSFAFGGNNVSVLLGAP